MPHHQKLSIASQKRRGSYVSSASVPGRKQEESWPAHGMCILFKSSLSDLTFPFFTYFIHWVYIGVGGI